jgi:hypothetical protein
MLQGGRMEYDIGCKNGLPYCIKIPDITESEMELAAGTCGPLV